MIRTWLADIRALYDEECYQKYFAALPAFRQEKARKLLFQKDRAQSAGAWLLLEEIRKRYKISDRAVYNLSHSGDYVLCAYSDVAKADNKKIPAAIGPTRHSAPYPRGNKH